MIKTNLLSQAALSSNKQVGLKPDRLNLNQILYQTLKIIIDRTVVSSVCHEIVVDDLCLQGNPEEHTILEFARLIKSLVGKASDQ